MRMQGTTGSMLIRPHYTEVADAQPQLWEHDFAGMPVSQEEIDEALRAVREPACGTEAPVLTVEQYAAVRRVIMGTHNGLGFTRMNPPPSAAGLPYPANGNKRDIARYLSQPVPARWTESQTYAILVIFALVGLVTTLGLLLSGMVG